MGMGEGADEGRRRAVSRVVRWRERDEKELQTIELGVVVDGSADADEDGVMERADVVGHEHGIWAAERQLLAMSASNLCVEGLGKGETHMGVIGRRELLEMREDGSEEMHEINT